MGKHAQDFGLSPAEQADRQWVQQHVEDIVQNPSETRQGAWNPNGGGGTDYWFFRQGSDVVITRADGTFVTVLQNGSTNGWFNGATVVK